MKTVALGESFNVFYQNVFPETDIGSLRFDVWNRDGNKLSTNLPLVQVPGSDVFYLNYTAPSHPEYLLFLLSSNIESRPTVVKVGNLPDRAYFWDSQSRLIIRYKIFNTTSTLEEGILQELPGGFYFTEVSFADPWFIELLNRAILKNT